MGDTGAEKGGNSKDCGISQTGGFIRPGLFSIGTRQVRMVETDSRDSVPDSKSVTLFFFTEAFNLLKAELPSPEPASA